MGLKLLRELRCTRSNRILISFVYFAAFVALGLCIAALGPALLELAKQVDTSLTYTGYAFAARSAGYFVGSFGGPLYDRVPGHLLLTLAFLLGGIGTMCIPMVRNVFALGAVCTLQGAAMGLVDTGANVLIIYLFGKDVGPFLQFMHFSFALGAFLSPMLLAATAQDASAGAASIGSGTYDIAFFVIAAACFLVGGALAWLHSPTGRPAATASPAKEPGAGELTPLIPLQTVSASVPRPRSYSTDLHMQPLWETQDTSDRAANEGDRLRIRRSSLPTAATRGFRGAAVHITPVPIATAAPASSGATVSKWPLVLVTGAMLFQYVGIETGFGGFITAYDVVYLSQSEGHGQLLASAYWGSIMASRLLAVPLSTVLRPARYLAVSMALCIIASIILVLADQDMVRVWVSIIIFGLGMGPIFPTGIALAESYFPVQGMDTTVFVVMSALGELAIPFCISSLFGNANADGGSTLPQATFAVSVGPQILHWTTLGVSIANALTLVCAVWLGWRFRKYAPLPTHT